MEIGLILFALLFVFVTLRRGRRFEENYREFPPPGLYSEGKSESPNLYGQHWANHLYPGTGETHHQNPERRRPKAS